jgi:spermidine synthase
LFLVSWLILFLELACIRWFPAHVLFLTFFTNVVLLACFLGMSVGCLAAGHRRSYLAWTPPLLLLAMAAAFGVGWLHERGLSVDTGQASPQLVFFGTETPSADVARFALPLEIVGGFFFLVLALALVGPGQELGRALTRLPDRVQAYTVNILGSVAGILLFALFSWLELSPLWWFGLLAVGLAYLLYRPNLRANLATGAVLLLVLAGAALTSGTPLGGHAVEHSWSPYYRIDYRPADRNIAVNLIGHQEMTSRRRRSTAYALPHLLNRDSGGAPFRDVLIIGAGSGNDVSRALQWGATHVDAVEIDPVIYRLGKRDHPDQPYDDPRVRIHLDDGRNFLRSTAKQYDLVVYALVDSLVLHSSYSNIRLESYLFTEQAFRDVRRCLKPNGQFVLYNFFRQGWIVSRLRDTLTAAFGAPPLVLPLPYRPTIEPDTVLYNEFTLFLVGDTDRLEKAFARGAEYWVHEKADRSPAGPRTPNGFGQRPGAADRRRWEGVPFEQRIDDPWQRFGPAEVGRPNEPLRLATDDWPFLYLRRPMIPGLSLRGMALMAGLSLLLLFLFRPRADSTPGEESAGGWGLAGRMFFLGAGFMLVETRAVVCMALLFGSTWVVNSVVFFAVLVMILLANLFVIRVRPQRLGLFYAGLLASLAVNALVPLDSFLGLPWAVQAVGSCLLVFAPIGFAAVVFAVSFAAAASPDRAFGANIAGAILGGLTEYASMVLGFQHLVLVALGFYALAIGFPLPAQPPAAQPAPEPVPVEAVV